VAEIHFEQRRARTPAAGAKFAKSYDIVCLVLSSPDELDEDEGNATGSSPRHLAGCKTKVSF